MNIVLLYPENIFKSINSILINNEFENHNGEHVFG